eukprot:COSAG06_NODE_1983_length_7920_cov_4.287303_4_plen_210_part_00
MERSRSPSRSSRGSRGQQLSPRQRQLRSDFAAAIDGASRATSHRTTELRQRRVEQREAVASSRRRLPVRCTSSLSVLVSPREALTHSCDMWTQAELSAYEHAATNQTAFLHGSVVSPLRATRSTAGLSSWGDEVAATTSWSSGPGGRGPSPPRAPRATSPTRQSALERSAAWAEQLVEEERVRHHLLSASSLCLLVPFAPASKVAQLAC